MDSHTVEITIKAYLKHMRERLERAASIARAAEACAEAGNVEKGIEIALDVEELNSRAQREVTVSEFALDSDRLIHSVAGAVYPHHAKAAAASARPRRSYCSRHVGRCRAFLRARSRASCPLQKHHTL